MEVEVVFGEFFILKDEAGKGRDSLTKALAVNWFLLELSRRESFEAYVTIGTSQEHHAQSVTTAMKVFQEF